MIDLIKVFLNKIQVQSAAQITLCQVVAVATRTPFLDSIIHSEKDTPG